MRPAASTAADRADRRDTQSDPTKAVNAATELTRRHKAHISWGPLNCGRGLGGYSLIGGVTACPRCTRAGRLVDRREEVPMAFRNAPPINKSAAPQTTMW